MIKILPLTLFALCFSNLSFGQSSDQGCLDAHLTLDDGMAMNSAGNNFHGSAYGTVATFNRYSEPDKALLFNGFGSHILLNNGQPVITDGNFTISAWVNLAGSGGGDENANYIFNQRANSETSNSEIELYIKNDSIFFTVRPDNQASFTVSGEVNIGSSWHHIHAIHQNDHIRIHLNGVEVARESISHSNTTFSGTDLAYLGYKRYDGTVYGALSGLMDEVKFYDCALTMENVMNEHWLYTSELEEKDRPLKLYPNPSTGLVFFDNESSNNQFEVYNLQGQLIHSGSCQNQIKLNHLPKGVYMISITDLQQSEVKQGRIILN